MPDFPVGLPDIPQANVSETLFTMHDQAGHVPATNRILANIGALAAKVGIGASTPGAVAAVLKRAASGQSVWGPVTAAEIAGSGVGDANTALVTGTPGTAVTFGKVSGNATGAGTGHILATSIPAGDLRGGGTGNTVARTTNGTDVSFGKVTAADLTAGVIGITKLGEYAALGNAAIMEMSGISNAYRSLTAIWVARSTFGGPATNAQINLTFEPSGAAGAYWYQRLYGNGAATGAQENAGTLNYIIAGVIPTGVSLAGLFSAGTITLHEYATAGISFHVAEVRAASTYNNAAGGNVVDAVSGMYFVSGPISLVRLTANAGNFAVGSRMTLYGWST